MKAEEQVKEMYPEAKIDQVRADERWDDPGLTYRVTIKPGRYAYGRMKSWAWKVALDAIQQDDELWKGRRVVGKGGK